MPDKQAGCQPGSCAHGLLVVNPHSRSGAEAEGRLEQALRESGFEPLGGRIGDGAQLRDVLARHADSLSPDADRIFVGGGDGTINRLLPTLVEAALPVALLPLGTANDLARTLGLPNDVEAAAAVARDGIAMPIDLGRVNDQLFANVASIGLGPKVTERLSQATKDYLGALSYIRALLVAYREVRPFRCLISVDGGRDRRIRAIHLAVGNGRYYGGGAVVEETAAIDDNRLDLYALSPMPLGRLLLAGHWLKQGRYQAIDGVMALRGSDITIRTRRHLPVSADGELITRTPAVFGVVQKALRIMVPRGLPGEGLRRGDGPGP
jgi:diacylglycerol kinase (ATP)